MVIASIVLAGPEEIVPVIIVLVVIGKIIKAIKEAASKGSSPARPAGKQKLEQDLERFFKNLTDQDGPIQAPPPPPVPAAARPARRRAASAQETPPPPPKAVRPIPAARAPKLQPVWGSDNYGLDDSAHGRASCSYTAKESRREIIAMIKDSNSIKKAVLLREILGPPVSMRG